MSFSFGFTEEELNNEDTGKLSTTAEKSALSVSNPLDSESLLDESMIQPQVSELRTILASLKDVRVSFEKIKTPELQVDLYRRELFDIKHQLMSENDTEVTNELDILINEDLRKNVYEGGLKSWECSIDLVDTLKSKLSINDIDCSIELGCGTALPSEFVFSEYLQSKSNSGLHLILTDYNESVLRLASLPNLVITWAKNILSQEQLSALQKSNDESMRINEDEIVLTEKLLEAFFSDMEARNLKIHFISGTWGRQFSNLVHSLANPQKGLLLLTSETIYQPDHLPIIAETLLDLKQNYKNVNVETLVAAKDIYFGVGGSILEFERYLTQKNVAFNTFKVTSGLKRSIVSL